MSTNHGENVNVTHDKAKGRLVIEVDLNKPGSPSATGKTIVLASTKGNKEVAPGFYLGLNLYRYAEARK